MCDNGVEAICGDRNVTRPMPENGEGVEGGRGGGGVLGEDLHAKVTGLYLSGIKIHGLVPLMVVKFKMTSVYKIPFWVLTRKIREEVNVSQLILVPLK